MPGVREALDALLNRRLPKMPMFAPDLAERLNLCRRYGNFSLAYSTAAQPDLRYFGDAAGYIAFDTKMGHTFVLGDPVCHQASKAAYIKGFLEVSGTACFVQVGRETAAILATHGYKVNHMGVDTLLPFETHTFAGKRNESVRYSEKWLMKNGYQILECDGTVAGAEYIKHISKSWRSGRIVSRREMRFLNRPFSSKLSVDMRRFVLLEPTGVPAAVLDFDPVFTDGSIVGYTAAFKRKVAGTTSHAEIGMTKFAVDRFRQEGRSHITLGLSPLAAIAESGFEESRIWRKFFEFAFRSKRVNQKIFNLQGQAAFKRRFHGGEVPAYIAFKRGTPIEMIALLRLLKTL